MVGGVVVGAGPWVEEKKLVILVEGEEDKPSMSPCRCEGRRADCDGA